MNFLMRFAFPLTHCFLNVCLINCLKTNTATIKVTYTYVHLHLQHQSNTKN